MPGPASLKIEIPERKAVVRAFKALGEKDAPFLKDAIEKGADMVVGAARRRAKGSIGASIYSEGARGTGIMVRARVVVKHPGSKPMEFGRQQYYTGFVGNNRGAAKRAKGSMIATGRKKYVAKGQKADPYLGIVKGNAAAGEVGPKFRELVGAAFEREFERLANG